MASSTEKTLDKNDAIPISPTWVGRLATASDFQMLARTNGRT